MVKAAHHRPDGPVRRQSHQGPLRDAPRPALAIDHSAHRRQTVGLQPAIDGQADDQIGGAARKVRRAAPFHCSR